MLRKVLNEFSKGDLKTPPLCMVALDGNMKLVTVLLNNFGADKNFKDKDGDTPLMNAALHDHLPVVETLLNAGADVNTSNNIGNTALHFAASGGFAGVAGALLDAGADFNVTDQYGQTPLRTAIAHRHLLVVKTLLNAGALETNALIIAAREGEDDIVDALLNAGANKDAFGQKDGTGDYKWAPLTVASEEGHLCVVKTLLAARAEVNAVNSNGVSALFSAAREGYDDIVCTLLRGGADKNITTVSNCTPLMTAVEFDNIPVTETLLEAGADLTIQDTTHGYTALHFAALYARVDQMRLLLRWGADERIVDQDGNTPGNLLQKQELDDKKVFESARKLLNQAPVDRADRIWRRRGWLVILRKRTDDARKAASTETRPKKQQQQPGVGGGTDGNEGQISDLVVVTATLWSAEGLFRNVVSFL